MDVRNSTLTRSSRILPCETYRSVIPITFPGFCLAACRAFSTACRLESGGKCADGYSARSVIRGDFMQVPSCPRSVSRCGKLSVDNMGESPVSHPPKRVSCSSRSFVPLRMTPLRRECGFTLVELMITLVVAVVLIVVAIPSFTNIIATNRLTTTGNDIVGAINSARMEAIKRNADTQVCSDSATINTSDTLGSKCGVQTGAVVVLTGSGTTATASLLLAAPSGIVAPIQLSGDMKAVRFTGQGLGQAPGGTSVPYNGLIVDICTSQISTNNHRQINMATGSILSTTTTSGACP